MQANKTEILQQSITRLLRRGAHAHVKRILLKSHPSEIAAVLRQSSSDTTFQIFQYIADTDLEPQTLMQLGAHFLKTYFNEHPDKKRLAKVLQKLPDDEVATLLSELDVSDVQEILGLMTKTTQVEVAEILQYDEDSCGRIMTVDVFSLNQNLSVSQAIEAIQKASHTESLFYLYITDDYENLVGVVSLRYLLQVEGKRLLKDIMTKDVVKVDCYESQEVAAEFVESYNLVSLPVVDKHGKLVGMITVDDVINYIRDEAKEEVFQLTGVEPEALENLSFWGALENRFLWYVLLLFGGIFSAEVLFYYLSAHSDVAYHTHLIKVCFLPLALRLGHSAALQGMTLMDQGFLNEDVEKTRSYKAIWLHALVTLLMGFLLSGLILFYIYVRFGSLKTEFLGLGLGLLFSGILSLIIGLILPLLLHFFKIDFLKVTSRLIHFTIDAINIAVYILFMEMSRYL